MLNIFDSLESFFVTHKEKFTLIPVFSVLIGTFSQIFTLTSLNVTAFFSWTQVMNEAISLGGILFFYSIFAISLIQISSLKKYGIYIFYGLSLCITLWMIIVILSGFSFIDVFTSTFQRSYTFFSFVMYVFIALFFYPNVFKKLTYIRKLVLIMILFFQIPIVLLAVYLSGYDYFSGNHTYLFYYKDKIYISNYFNDKYIFTVLEGGKTLSIPLSEIKGMVQPYMAVGVLEGIQVLDPDEELKNTMAPPNTPLVANKEYTILKPLKK